MMGMDPWTYLSNVVYTGGQFYILENDYMNESFESCANGQEEQACFCIPKPLLLMDSLCRLVTIVTRN